MFSVKTLGLEIILVFPKDCSASISSFSAAVPKVLIIPMPLVPPVIELFVTVPAAAPKLIPAPVVAAPPMVPDIISEPVYPDTPFSVIAPILVPKAF